MEENEQNSPENQQPRPDNTQTPTPEPVSAPETQSAPASESQTAEPAVLEGSKDARLWAMLCHLSALAAYIGIPFGNILGPLIIWLIKKDEFTFVNQQGKEALNFQISMSIYCLVASPLICLAGLGFIVMAAIGIVDLIFVVIAAVKTNSGEAYRYPITIRMIK